MASRTLIRESAEAWKLLNGIICVYKPVGVPLFLVKDTLRQKLCDDLNSMKCRDTETIVKIQQIPKLGTVGNLSKAVAAIPPASRSSHSSITHPKSQQQLPQATSFIPEVLHTVNDEYQVVKVLNYADHPLVVGPRHQKQDFKLLTANYLYKNTSGIVLVGLNNAARIAMKIKHNRWLSCYRISAEFGKATEDGFYNSVVIDKSTYHKLKRHMVERVLESMQALHQRAMFEASGAPLQTEEAYQLASKGLVRPEGKTDPIIYAFKLISFNLPYWEFEVHTINEDEVFLQTLANTIAIKLHNTAMTTKIRCIKYGPFTAEDDALLMRHWTVEHVLGNIAQCKQRLDGLNLNIRNPWLYGSSPQDNEVVTEAKPGEPIIASDDKEYAQYT